MYSDASLCGRTGNDSLVVLAIFCIIEQFTLLKKEVADKCDNHFDMCVVVGVQPAKAYFPIILFVFLVVY